MPSIDQCDGASALTALPSTLEIFDKFKSVSENGKLSDSEESFHLLLDDDETENQSNGGTHNDETEDDILNKFETNTPESDLRAEESFLNDEEEQCSSKIKLKTIVKISSKDENYCESPEGEFKSLYEDEVEPDPASTPTSEPTMEVTEETNGDNTSEDSMGMEEENNIANLIDKLEEDDKEEEEKPVENGTPMEQDSCDIDEATEPEKQEMTEDDREEATPLNTAKDDTPEEELKNDETALESDAKDQESSDEKPLEKDPLADDQVFKVPEELPKEPQESDDKSNDRTEDESDLLDVTMVRETEEDDACAMADAMTDIETRTSEKSDEEQSEDRMDTEQETSDNDKDFDDNAMSFDGMDEDSHTSSSSQTKQENKVVEETSDTSNNAVEEELPAEVEAVAPDKPEEEKQEEIGEEMAVEPPSANENDEDRLVIKEKEQCVKETSEKSDKVVLVDNKKTEEVTKEGAKDEGERVENPEKTDQNVPETNQISLNKRAHLSIEEEPEEEVQIPKKPKLVTEITPAAPPPSTLDKLKVLSDFAKFMQCKKLTSKLTRSDLEQFCIQKICESLMLKSTEGELHQMIRKQEKIIESLRKDLVQLSKQCKDLDIVNKKLMSEIRNPNAPKRPLVPLKITRSVGLQVRLNPGSDPSQNRNKRTSIGGGVTPTNTTSNTPQKQQTPSPVVNRKVAAPTQSTVGAQQASVVRQVLQNSPQRSSPLTSASTTTTASSSLLGTALQPQKRQSPAIISKRSSNNPSTATPPRKTGAGVIVDLTDEDDRLAQQAKSAGSNTIKIISRPSPQGANKTAKNSNATVKTNVVPGKQIMTKTVTGKQTTLPQGIRLAQAIQTSSANGSPQMVYVVPTITNAGGQQKVAFVNFQSTIPGQTVSVLANNKTSAPGLTLKPVGAGGGVPPPVQRFPKHPAPLPTVRVALDPKLKPLLPKPHLTIKRIDTGIILQWKMPYNLDQYESIASYQLYAYQETSAPPSTDMWRKVGDVKALALPMACTLTQFADKNKYYFAVRSVDVHKRIGAFSDPEEISL